MDLINIDQKNSDSRKPNDVDFHVGKCIKKIRDAKNMSQKKLADLVGITFQQLQKYENGINRIVAGRLYDFSRVLSVPISAFFEGIDEEDKKQYLEKKDEYCFAEPTPDIDYSSIEKREREKLLDAFCKIKDRRKARKIYEYIINLADDENAVFSEDEDDGK